MDDVKMCYVQVLRTEDGRVHVAKRPFVNTRKIKLDRYLSPEAERYILEYGSDAVWQGDDE